VIYSPTALDLPKHAPPKASWPSMSILRAFAALRSWFCRPTRRKRKALGLALIGVCTAGSQGVSRAQGDERPITISLDAEDIEYSDPDSSALLTGNVRLKATDLPGKIPEVEMTTDRLEVSLDTGDVRAPVGATFEMPQVWITGQDLHYNIRSQQLGAVDARSRVRVPLGRRELTVYGQSDRVEASDEDVQFHKASISTCDREHPHYALRARRVRVKVDTEELFVYGGSIYLYGVEVPLVGKFSTKISRVGADRRLMKIPMLGYSAREGVYIPFEKGFSAPGDPIRATADLKLTQRHLIAGTLLAERSRPGLRAWVTAARRVEMEDDITHRLVYDALPELGMEVSAQQGASTLSAAFRGGHYRDEDVRTGQRAHEGAATLGLNWDWERQDDLGRPRLWAGAGARGSLYTSGDSYRTVDLRLGAATALWPGARGQLELLHHIIGGQTPFEFDDVDLRTEAAVALQTPLAGPWAVGLTGRYDIDRGSLRDYTVDLQRQAHCLTWHLRYRKVGSRIGIGVDLTDLIDEEPGPFRRSKPGWPAGPPVTQLPEVDALPKLVSVPTVTSVPRESTPSEYQLAQDHRPRAPDVTDPFLRRPPPSLRLAHAGAFW
jgi:hypothetical protein